MRTDVVTAAAAVATDQSAVAAINTTATSCSDIVVPAASAGILCQGMYVTL